MASRKPNMLEAFQHSARAAREASEQEAKAQRSGAPKKAAPAEPERSRQPTTTPSNADLFGDDLLGTRPLARPGFPIWMPVAVIVLLAAMAGTYWVTRQLGNEAKAGGGDSELELPEDVELDLRALSDETEGPAVTPKTQPSVEPATSKLTADDRRFLDTANVYTVRAIQFPRDARGKELARAAYKHLRDAGFPAISPLEMNDIVVVCVGAEPKRSGRLAQIRTRLQDLDGPPPQNEPGAFSGAYDVNIDDYYDR
jgi:hypothetical protein